MFSRDVKVDVSPKRSAGVFDWSSLIRKLKKRRKRKSLE